MRFVIMRKADKKTKACVLPAMRASIKGLPESKWKTLRCGVSGPLTLAMSFRQGHENSVRGVTLIRVCESKIAQTLAYAKTHFGESKECS